MIGKKILNYEIKSLIGEGGMGNVYLAEHMQLGRKVAIKSLHAQLVKNQGIRGRFKNEASALASIQHPNIVGLYDYHEDENGLYLILEYVDGIPMDAYIRNMSGPIPAQRAVSFLNQVLDAVGYAHSLGIVHRDLKPGNILLSKTGTVKILDFGIAKIFSETDNSMTKTGTQMGTVFYMSPEQVHGAAVDYRTDVYALGVTLFQMVTGVSPYEGMNTEFAIYNKIVTEPLPPVQSIYPGAEGWLDHVIRVATAKNPDERFQNCNEFKAALQNYQSAPPPSVAQPTVQLPPRKAAPKSPAESLADLSDQPLKRKRPLWIIPVALVAVAAICIVLYILTRPEPEEVAAEIANEYRSYFDAGLSPGMSSMELEALLDENKSRISNRLSEARNLFGDDEEKLNRFDYTYEHTADSIAEEMGWRIDAALGNQLLGGMWAKQGEDDAKNYLYYFSGDTMYMVNRKASFTYAVHNGDLVFTEGFTSQINFISTDEFTLNVPSAKSGPQVVTYTRATSQDSIVGTWTATTTSDPYYSTYFRTWIYPSPTSHAMVMKPDATLETGYNSYRYKFVDGKMTWYNLSGAESDSWNGWYLQTKNTFRRPGMSIATMYRSRSKAPDSPSVMVE